MKLETNLKFAQAAFWIVILVTIFEWRFVGWRQGLVGLMISTLLFGVWVWCEGTLEKSLTQPLPSKRERGKKVEGNNGNK
jgi:hypothetical protein